MNGNPKRFSVLAAVSLLLGIVGIVALTPYSGFLNRWASASVDRIFQFPVAALVCGVAALHRIRRNPGDRGRWAAVAGVVLGSAVVALLLAVLGLRIRIARHYRICGQNLQQIEHAAQRAGQDDRYYAAGPERQMKMLLGQLPGGRLPVCPGGGKYTIQTPNGGGHCSKHGDPTTCKMGI